MEPPVSEPRLKGSAAGSHHGGRTAADPPGTRCKSQGLRTGPKAEVLLSAPMANSSKFTLPSNGLRDSFSTTAASKGET